MYYSTSGHSSEGVEQVSINLIIIYSAGNYYIFTHWTIYSIILLFQPVEPDEAKFTVATGS